MAQLLSSFEFAPAVFGGRLGTYRYLDMHQAIGAARKAFENEVAPVLSK